MVDIESILLKGGANDLRNFKTLILQKLEKANEQLLSTYFNFNFKVVSFSVEYILSGQQKEGMD
jgi:hypothetical protein